MVAVDALVHPGVLMRLWSLHPAHLDRQGLIACWREALLAQKVLAGLTTGYRSHPQLIRFRAADGPLAAIGAYLSGLAEEADARGYRFDRTKIHDGSGHAQLPVTTGQLDFEAQHLAAKLALRSPADADRLADARPRTHPLFRLGPGPIEDWERP